jgi:hypothetical protein
MKTIISKTIVSKLTPSDISKICGCAIEKVYRWIASGELRAFDASTRRDSGKPRWLIDPADWELFQASRMATPAPATPRSRRAASNVPEYV